MYERDQWKALPLGGFGRLWCSRSRSERALAAGLTLVHFLANRKLILWDTTPVFNVSRLNINACCAIPRLFSVIKQLRLS